MSKITIPENCGNSPKAEFIKEFNVAFVNGDSGAILNSFNDNIKWSIIGDAVVEGEDNVRKFLEEMLDMSIEELTIEKIITHGDEAATYGWMKMSDGKVYETCDIYTFDSHAKDAKILELKSFIIEKAT